MSKINSKNTSIDIPEVDRGERSITEGNIVHLLYLVESYENQSPKALLYELCYLLQMNIDRYYEAGYAEYGRIITYKDICEVPFDTIVRRVKELFKQNGYANEGERFRILYDSRRENGI